LSLNFKHGDQLVWNPANAVGQVFLRLVEALEPQAGAETGITTLIPGDTYGIEPEKLRAFTETLLGWYFNTNHPVYRDLFGGVLKCCLVLLERSDNAIEFDTSGDERHAFAQAVAEQAKSMAR
jgi:hypothetical protein